MYECNKQNRQEWPVVAYDWNTDGCSDSVDLVFESDVWKLDGK